MSGREHACTAEGGVRTKTVEQRLTVVENKVAENARGADGLREAIVELGNRMDRRFGAMDQNTSRQFRVIVGMQLTALLAMIGAVATLAAALGR